jgi:hypothetical protein
MIVIDAGSGVWTTEIPSRATIGGKPVGVPWARKVSVSVALVAV